ncbi:hypothetical protein ABT294_00700 [Nonomuraea sp. NPDC000554]|uniref:hypothetical protein n=1 Tax=Nonomuraea sp. NPDC000554 TaxID=3154259 RepID=UPI00332DA07E
MTNTTPEVPADLLDQVLAGWSLLMAAHPSGVPQVKCAEAAIREALTYAREQAKTIVTINGNRYKVGEWDLREPGLEPGDDWTWTLYATRVADSPEEG